MHRNFHKDIFTKKNCKRIVDFKNKIHCFLPNLFAACGLGLNSKKTFFFICNLRSRLLGQAHCNWLK